MNGDRVSDKVLSWAAAACMAGAVAVAIVTLAGWSTGRSWLAACGPEYVPMAPVTAWLMILLGSGSLLRLRGPSSAVLRSVLYCVAFAVGGACLLVCVRSALSFELPLEEWLAPTTVRVEDIPVGRMSPVTAASVLFAASAFGLGIPPLGRNRLARRIELGLVLASITIALMVLVSYALGAPLFYGSPTIPMALPTAISVGLLCCGLLMAVGARTASSRVFTAPADPYPSSSRRFSRGVLLAFLVLLVGIGLAGRAYFAHQLWESRQTAEEHLATVANLKVRQIVDWRDERVSDAQVILEDPFLAEQVRKLAEGVAVREIGPALLARLGSIAKHNQCLRVVLLDPQMKVLLAYPEEQSYFGPTAQSTAVAAARGGVVKLSDLHRSQFSGAIHLDLAVPLRLWGIRREAADSRGSDTGVRCTGVILMEIDPYKVLYPNVLAWPTSSPTAETALIRREGDELVCLNELRHRTKTALSFRVPADERRGMRAAITARKEGIVEGLDYRDVPVLASVRKVPGLGWILVAKVDQEEIFAPLRERAWNTGAILVGIILLVATGVVGLIRHHNSQWLRSQLLADREKERKFRAVFDQTFQFMGLLTPDGKLVEANQTALALAGGNGRELLGKPFWETTWWAHSTEMQKAVHRAVRAAAAGELVRFEATLRSADGALRHADFSLKPVADERGQVVLLIPEGRDISDRKRAETELAHAQKLEAIGRLAAGVAHEINTPAQYVGDNLRFLEEAFGSLESLLAALEDLDCGVEPDDRSRGAMAEIETRAAALDTPYLRREIPSALRQSLEGIEQIASIVRAMKEFSYPGSDDKRLVDVNRAIRNTVTVAHNQWKHVARIETDLDPSLPLVPCIVAGLNQTVLNLLINAADAISDVVGDGSRGLGTITIRTRCEGDWAEIEIADTGTGIPEEIRSRVFEPFFTTKEVGCGTGQGLAIARSTIVERLGGTIRFETEMGQGTRFIVRLPISEKLDESSVSSVPKVCLG